MTRTCTVCNRFVDDDPRPGIGECRSCGTELDHASTLCPLCAAEGACPGCGQLGLALAEEERLALLLASIRKHLYDLVDGADAHPPDTRELYDLLERELCAITDPDSPGYEPLTRYCWMIAEEFTEGATF